jgi:chromate reductase, NAD(P)H dehydrogenase (quinone)
MITIISGTNRAGSNTRKVANLYKNLLENEKEAVQIYSLEELPRDFAFSYFAANHTPEFKQQLQTFIEPVQKFIVVVPEYNGSFAGIFKLFLDAVHPSLLRGKKIALVGVADGRAGNLRGIDQLTNAFHYLGVTVYPKNMPVSLINQRFDANTGEFNDEQTLGAMKSQVQGFVQF